MLAMTVNITHFLCCVIWFGSYLHNCHLPGIFCILIHRNDHCAVMFIIIVILKQKILAVIAQRTLVYCNFPAHFSFIKITYLFCPKNYLISFQGLYFDK